MKDARSLRSIGLWFGRRQGMRPLAVLILLGVAGGSASTVHAAPPCAPCGLLIADNAMYDTSTTPSHKQFLAQRRLVPNLGLDVLKLQGWMSNANFMAWMPEANGAQVCFSDQNAGGDFTGTTETLTGQAFDGTKGWTSNSSGTAHKYKDVSSPPKVVVAKVVQTPTAWKVLVVIKNASASYGTTTPNADRPASAIVYFNTGGTSGCGHTTFGASDCEDNADSTTEICKR